MPKLKTNKSVKKRFSVTKRKKLKHSKSRRRHLLTDKSGKKKRSMRGKTIVGPTEHGNLMKLLPYA